MSITMDEEIKRWTAKRKNALLCRNSWVTQVSQLRREALLRIMPKDDSALFKLFGKPGIELGDIHPYILKNELENASCTQKTVRLYLRKRINL